MGEFDGMSVNERLFAAGLFPAWDRAIESKDRGILRELLEKVELGDQADLIIDSALKYHLQ